MKIFLEWLDNLITIYRGTSVHNKNGRYWTTNKEWARQFTQSGQDSEILTAKIDPTKIFKPDPLPNATDENELNQAVQTARNQGFLAVWVNEGLNEPNSVYILSKGALKF